MKTKRSNTLFPRVFINTLFSASLVLTGAQAFAAPEVVDEVIAIVNKKVILASDVEELTESVAARAKKAGQTLPDEAVFQQQALDKLIMDSLQMQLAESMGMRVSNAQLEDTIRNIAAGDGKTVDQVRQEVIAEGGNYNAYKEDIRTQILTNEVKRMQMRRRITISDQDVENLLEIMKEQGEKNVQYNINHLMLKVPTDSSAADVTATQARIDGLKAQVIAGEKFADIALANSAGPKALNGGNWGWMNINEMPTLFAEVVIGGKKGEVFGPFRSASGLHLIQIQDLRGKQTVLTKEVSARHILIKPSVILSDEKAKELLEGYLQRIQSGDAKFEELAKAYSEDPGSALRGGELGWADPSVYVPAFKNALADLQKDEISQPFRSSHGWHIVQLLDRRTQDTTDKANRQKAWQLLYNRRAAEESQAWLNELKQEAYIRIIDNKQ